jgi:hypothetical protein
MAGSATRLPPHATSLAVGEETPLARRLLIDAHLGAGDAINANAEADALERWAADDTAPLDQATKAALGRARRALGADLGTADQPGNGNAALVAELVGRDREFAVALEAWQAVRNGASRHVHLVAPAGLGKTRLMQDLATRLHHSGAAVRYLRAHPGDRELPGALAAELARALTAFDGAKSVPPNVAETLVALDPSLANFYSAAPDPAIGDEARRRRAFALTELFRATGEAGPHALLVDDLHWADDESFAILEALLARAEEGRALVITATRPLQTRHLRSEHRLTLSLDPLTAVQVAELAGSIATFEPTGALATLPDGLANSTGGNPLLILELLQLARDRDILTIEDGEWQCTAPDRLAALLREGEGIRQRLARLGPESRDTLRMLAIAGAPLSAAVLAKALAIPRAVASERLDLLERMGLAQRSSTDWETAHDTIGDAAADGEGPVITTARRQLADALEQVGDSSLPTLSRAMQLWRSVGDVTAMARVADAAITRERARGRRPSPSELIARLLGGPRDDTLARAVYGALPAAMRWRPRVPAVAAVALLGIGLTAALAARPKPEEQPTILEVSWLSEDGTIDALHVPLPAEGWNAELPLTGRSAPLSHVLRHLGNRSPDYAIAYSTGGDSAVTTWRRPDSGDLDIVLLTRDSLVWLTDAPRDDTAPAFLPDGSGIVFVTSRWSPEGDDDVDVAILHFADRSITRLTSGPDTDIGPQPSPDGLRIAFFRRYRSERANEVCVATISGQMLTCSVAHGVKLNSPFGWLDNDHLLASADSAGMILLLRMHATTGQRETLARGMFYPPAMDAGRQVVACVCEDPETRRLEVRVLDLRYPGAWRSVALPAGANPDRLAMVRRAHAPRAIGRIAITPPGVIRAGTLHRLSVAGFGGDGRPLLFDTTVVRWQSSDSLIASVHPASGLLTAVAPGLVTIQAVAGPTQRDSVHVVVGESLAEIVLEESWSSPAPSIWRLYGVPTAEIRTHPHLGRALFNRGDGVDQSGAYTVSSYSADVGLTIEMEISSPMRRDKWQRLVVELVSARDSLLLADWDHGGGAAPGTRIRSGTACSVAHPASEGENSFRGFEVAVGHRNITASAVPPMWSGEVYRLRLALLADGRCGVAVNGQPIFLSPTSIPLDAPKRLWISGNSVGTDIAVGKVTVWQGDPGGVDWSSVQ